jgi:hypothetical protein
MAAAIRSPDLFPHTLPLLMLVSPLAALLSAYHEAPPAATRDPTRQSEGTAAYPVDNHLDRSDNPAIVIGQ